MIGVVEMTSYPPPLQLENATNATSDCTLYQIASSGGKEKIQKILF